TLTPGQDPMTDLEYEIREKRTVYSGFFRIDRYRLRHRLFGGGWSDEITREIFERGHAVAVLLYDPVRDAVVFLEQFRIGAVAAGMAPWQTEVVAGVIDCDETPEAVARREAREEAGCEITALAPIARYLVSPGGTSESIWLFCGCVDSGGVGGIHGLAHEHEDIRVEVVPHAEAHRRLRAGDFLNAPVIIALQWLAANRDDLRRRWREPGD
ncbi:MAG: NUDIX domain-containing protein, partial [Dongiaceae bacterium]